jgi:hypothetical protein
METSGDQMKTQGMRHTSTALEKGYFWKYVISDKLWF